MGSFELWTLQTIQIATNSESKFQQDPTEHSSSDLQSLISPQESPLNSPLDINFEDRINIIFSSPLFQRPL